MSEAVLEMDLHYAYAACREIARREAKNFYYAFLALPKHKSDAMCAVYAFMRRADDISDEESLPIETRRHMMQEWIDSWHRARAGETTADPVFIALRDTQQRFGITNELLDQLVQGTALDLSLNLEAVAESDGTAAHLHLATIAGTAVLQDYQVYEQFDELYRYCYLVASVVGLVCIRIFGYEDARAEKLAEETGIAFQLTNILRDVREDAERGRVYLPLEDLEKFSVDLETFAQLKDGRHMTLNQRELMEFEVQRAYKFYESAEALLPLISADSRPALWVLVTIYRTLLDRISAADFNVFSHRVQVPTTTKLSILLRGMLQVVRYRVTGKAS
ncbi:MAG: phytoene/squalene synthase family protein [Acidobacteriaceae bacterium]